MGSDRKVATDICFNHVLGGSGKNYLAPIHDREGIGQIAGELKILFDQQDSYVASLGKQADHSFDILDDGWLDAFGRLVQHQQIGGFQEEAGQQARPRQTIGRPGRLSVLRCARLADLLTVFPISTLPNDNWSGVTEISATGWAVPVPAKATEADD